MGGKLLNRFLDFPTPRIEQLVNVQNHLFSAIRGNIQFSGIHPDGILRTNFYAITAVDTYPKIQIELYGVLFNVGIGMLACDNIDTFCGTYRFA